MDYFNKLEFFNTLAMVEHLGSLDAPPFKWSHLWEPAIVNPVNLKSRTIPVFNLRDPYARVFHLSWRKSIPSHFGLEESD